MLAILGLFGLALSAVMITGHDANDMDVHDEGDTELEPLGDDAASDVVQLDELLGSSETGFADTSDENINYTAGSEGDVITTGAGDDLIDAGDGDDTVDTGAGNDEVHGGLGDDIVYGNDGIDHLLGHVGNDTLYGGSGDDDLNGGDGHDFVDGGEGDDAISGSIGNDLLIGGNGSDVMFGGDGNDVLDGRDDGSKDFINGGDGDDVFIAGSGDNLNGGDGADLFAMEIDTSALIDDFNIDEDSIEIAYDQTGPVPTLSYHDSDDGVILMADDTPVATFAGLTSLDLASVPVVMTPV